MNILVVDDDAYLCGVIRSYLEKDSDYRVHTAHSGRETFDILKSIRFDMVILDVNLPDIQGVDILQEIRKTKTSMELPVMMITALSDQAKIIQSFNLGANEFIAKPLDMAIFQVRVQNLLSTRSEFMGTGYRHLAAQLVDKPTPQDRDLDVVVPDEDQSVECHLLVSIAVGAMVFFGKTALLGAKEIVLTSRDLDLPKLQQFKIQIVHRLTGSQKLILNETYREIRGDGDTQTIHVRGTLCDPGRWYLTLLAHLQNAFNRDGQKGVQSYLAAGANQSADLLSTTSGQGQEEVVSKSAQPVSRLVSQQRYQFERIIGKGGFASVFLVKDLSLKRSVAMKVLDPTYSRKADSRRNFLFEAQIVAQFDHPNIVLVHEVSEVLPSDYDHLLDFPENILNEYPEGIVYFTMPYIQGQMIGDIHLGKRPISLTRRIGYMIDMAKALSYAHGMGVIHRDFKPQNILVTPNDQVVVMDFGIARTADSHTLDRADGVQPEAKPQGQFACTPYFAAPEQLAGDVPDLRSDLYSFGLVCYELISEKKAFTTSSLHELLRQKIQVGPQPILDVKPDFPEDLCSLIMSCMDTKPEKRPSNSEEIITRLEPIKNRLHSQSSGATKVSVKGLMEQLVIADRGEDARAVLEKLYKLVVLYKSFDNPKSFHQIGTFLTKPEILDLLLERNLIPENVDVLARLFSFLSSRLPVSYLLQHFQKCQQPWAMEFLAAALVDASENNLMSLALLGLELKDAKAVFLLKAFCRLGNRCPVNVLKKWAEHPGSLTQATLLSLCKGLIGRHDGVEQVLACIAENSPEHAKEANTLINAIRS